MSIDIKLKADDYLKKRKQNSSAWSGKKAS